MSNYTKSTNFATKDNLTPGDPLKVVRGTEIDTEYNNIATAIATKTDNASAAITGGAIDGATVGSTTPAAGAFTTLAASGTTTLAGALVGAATQAAFNTTTTTLNLGGAATAVNLGAATGTATVNNTTLAAKAITASTTLAVTGTSTLTGAVTATAGVTGPITSSSVSITGGSITGITDLAVADGGTGASTAAGGLNNLLPSQTGNANKYLQTDGTNASWDAVSLSTSDITGTLPVANGGTGVTSSTGTGNVVLSTSPTLVTPALGTPSALVGTNITGTASGLTAGNVTTNANLTGAVTSVGNATSLGSFTSSQLATALTDETGSGANVFATSPTLVTPVLGTPTSATLTNATGLPLTTGVTGTLPTANGGTNLTSFTSGGVVYASGTGTLATGSALQFNGTNEFKVISASSTAYNRAESTAFGTFAQHFATSGGAGVEYKTLYRFVDTDAGEIMRLTSTSLYTASGINVGIGTSSPSSKLTVAGSGATLGQFISSGSASYIEMDNSGGGGYIGTTGNNIVFLTSTGGTERARIDSSGNLLVGTTSALGGRIDAICSASLWGIGLKNTSTASNAIVFLNSSGSSVGSVYIDASSTSYVTSSDYRLKNITGALTGYKERLMSLLPKQGSWKVDGSEFRGFVAHDFANQYPKSVVGEKDAVDADGKPVMQGMQASSSEVMADLVAMVKDLVTENESLKARLDAANL